MSRPLNIVVATACLLHLYTMTFKTESGGSSFALALLALSLTPYAFASILARFRRTAGFAFGFAAGALIGDCLMHYSVFIAPKGSTAALGLLFMPIWNLLLLGPMGALIGRAFGRRADRRSGKNAA